MTNEDDFSPLKALHIALKKEKEAYNFYKEAINKAENPSTKKMFKFLAEEEVKHQQIIQDELDKGFYTEN